MRNAYNILVVNPDGNISLGRIRVDERMILKWVVRQ
jgi:hypothetical protein